MPSPFPNTGSTMGTSLAGKKISTGLSTQIIIKVNNIPVGAITSLKVDQRRGLDRVKEVGTDGVIEIVPKSAAEYTLTVSRLVFDQMRLPEAFARNFRLIAAQRLPFDIDIYEKEDAALADGSGNVVTTSFINCWFESYGYTYGADDYKIMEDATIWAETAKITNTKSVAFRSVAKQIDNAGIEQQVNEGGRRGSMDAAGLVRSIFPDWNS